ncbi:cell wall-binding protein [Bacillus toyonensis]|uniref:N-acetylmuramoyl-L-alanine amidase family protein n=1 Tax=Bacillus toyonensis TaxID=155322 RepID=UPI003D1FCD74
MKKKFKTTGVGKKVIPATAALGILFSMAPIAENKASAGIGAVLEGGITIFGAIANVYETLGLAPGDIEPSTTIDVYAENIAYKAPNFTTGEFNISMHHTKGDSNFTKSVKVLYPNGEIEIHKLKSGQQLKITQAGIIIDLNPDAKSISGHDLLYITQAQLDEGKTGVVMNEDHTGFVEKASGKNPRLLNPLYKKYATDDPVRDWTVIAKDGDYLFNQISNKLSNEQKQLVTLTSKPVSKDVLSNYLTNDYEALADFHNRSVNILADTTQVLETLIRVGNHLLEGNKTYQIIPIKKGSNKVFVKTGSKYLSGKEVGKFEYSDSISDAEVFELAEIEKNSKGDFQFHLINKNGARLAHTHEGQRFTTDANNSSNVYFAEKTNSEIHNWLREWYPGKENEKQMYDGIQIIADEKDPTKKSAKDSSGNVIKNSWVAFSSSHYYAGSDGVFLKDWHDIEGQAYYFGPDGAAFKGGYINPDIDGKQYHFDEKGALQKSAWLNKKYSDHTGAFVKEGLREIDGKIHYFQNYETTTNELRLENQNIVLHFSDKGVLEKASRPDGTELKGNNGTYVTLDKKTLFFEKDGSIRKSGVSKGYAILAGENKPVLNYYSLEDGLLYSGWKEIDGKLYHFQDGRHTTFNGNEDIDGKRYYFNQDGEAIQTGFVKKDGKTYYYDDNGIMLTGWQKINDKWHSFDNSGEATVGKFTAWSRTSSAFGKYNFCAKENGEIYVNETVRLETKHGYRDHIFDEYGHYTIKWDS